MSDAVLAIDFGTSNSLVGAWVDGQRVEALPLDPAASDPTLMRTLLYFLHADACFYGVEAIAQYLENEMEGRLFRSFKTHLPNQQYLGTFVDNRAVTLETMIGIFLLELKRRAEKLLGRTVNAAVIGRPARYSLDPVADSFALHRMEKAATLAGFTQVEFVPEPLAAALDLRRTLKSERLVLVGDFGGGTSDFTLLRMGPYAFDKSHVLGLSGAPQAGDALDSLFMSHRLNQYFGAQVRYRVSLGNNWLTMPASVMDRLNLPAHIVHLSEPSTYAFINEVRRGTRTDVDVAAIERLFTLIDDQQIFSFFEAIERTKRGLSDSKHSKFTFDYPDLELEVDFERDQFDQWADVTRTKIFAALDDCLRQAGVTPEQIDLVCLTGGSSKVPLLNNELEQRFGREKLQTTAQFHSVLSGLIESAANFKPRASAV